jgi:ATP-dependent Zn protease
MDGEVAGRIEEIVSKASYKADMEGKLTNKLLVKEITRFLQGPPVDIHLTDDLKMQTGYHEFGGHTLPAYAIGLEPILVSIEPAADGTVGKSFHRHSKSIPPASSKYYFADAVTRMGSTAVYLEFEKSMEEGRMNDLTNATSSALDLLALKNPMIKMAIGREGTYLSRGLFSEDNRKEIEGEVEKIKNEALKIAQDIIKNYRNEISAFIKEHLLNNEIMVRTDIIDILHKMGVQPGQYYEVMCKTLDRLSYLV